MLTNSKILIADRYVHIARIVHDTINTIYSVPQLGILVGVQANIIGPM